MWDLIGRTLTDTRRRWPLTRLCASSKIAYLNMSSTMNMGSVDILHGGKCIRINLDPNHKRGDTIVTWSRFNPNTAILSSDARIVVRKMMIKLEYSRKGVGKDKAVAKAAFNAWPGRRKLDLKTPLWTSRLEQGF